MPEAAAQHTFRILKVWDNRETATPFRNVSGRKWDRRIQILRSQHGQYKIRMREKDHYIEVIPISKKRAQMAYEEFMGGTPMTLVVKIAQRLHDPIPNN